MSFNNGVVPQSAQPAKDVMDTLRTVIDAHAAWEYVEEVAGTGTNVAQVFKCLGSVNGFADFFIALVRTSLTSRVGIVAGELYDSGTKEFTVGIPWLTTTTFTPNTGNAWRYNAARHVANANTMVASTQGFLLCPKSTAAATFTPGDAGVPIPAASTTAVDYWISVTNDHVVFSTMFSGAGTPTCTGAGLYESFHAVPAVEAFPLVVWAGHAPNSATAHTQAGLSRATGAIEGIAGTYAFPTCGHIRTAALPPNRATGASKERISNRYLVSRVLLAGVLGTATSRPGYMAGLLPAHVGITAMEDQTEAIGDQLTIDGAQWTFMDVASNATYSWIVNTAA